MFATPSTKLSRKRQQTTAIVFVMDGGGSVLPTGIRGDLDIPFGCTIQSMILVADQVGSLVVDIWKAAFASYPPTVANSITASDLPTLSSTDHNQDSTLTGWTKTINAGDTLRFNVNSVATITRATLTLQVIKA